MHRSTLGFSHATLMIRQGDAASDRFRELLQSAFEQKLLTSEIIDTLREKASDQGQDAQGLIVILDQFKTKLCEANNEAKEEIKESKAENKPSVP